MNLEKEHKSPMEVLAAFIVDKRNLIFFFYICAMIFSVFSQGWVHVENDITAYLPEDTETRQGLSIMEDELTTYGSARIVIAHASEELAEQLADKMAQIDGVTSAVVGTDSVGGGEEEETAEDISEYIQCYLRGYIEELPILSDTKVGKSVYCLMDNFLYFIVFCSFDRSKYFKGHILVIISSYYLP